MLIRKLKVTDFRTLESLDLDFTSLYSAICGANDSGKTNVVKAIRSLVKEEGPFYSNYAFDDPSCKDDYPKWKATEAPQKEIKLEITVELDRTRDAGFFEFICTQLSLAAKSDRLLVTIERTIRPDRADVRAISEGKEFVDLPAQEVLKKLQSSKSILFHNSTATERSYFYESSGIAGNIREITCHHEVLIEKMKKTVADGLEKISKSQQAELEGLIGRLRTKYKVGLSMPAFDLNYLPFSITLGDSKVEVPLGDWGSGTRNRTYILLNLFRARQIGDSERSAEKITPVIVIEEPESFLHPAAQAEFGRVLQDLAEEFQVQVIVTTHSPYLLNLRDSASNFLLQRRVENRQLRETERIDTGGDNWMAPFGQALGLDSKEFEPWRRLVLSSAKSILLVEGETDKAYFEMLRDESHGANRLMVTCEIAAYGGFGSLTNTVLLKFIMDRYESFFVTYDLDANQHVERTLRSLKLEKGKQYLPIGINAPGKKRIEGLLPEKVTTAVYSTHPDLVTALSGSREEREEADQTLKNLLLEEFKKQAIPGAEYYQHFYALTKTLNRVLPR
jgi:putative ATP-dependent endonuclease of the OLD family